MLTSQRAVARMGGEEDWVTCSVVSEKQGFLGGSAVWVGLCARLAQTCWPILRKPASQVEQRSEMQLRIICTGEVMGAMTERGG